MTLAPLRDPLLAGTRLLLTLLLIVFGFCLAVLAIATVALPLPFAQGQIADLGLAPGASNWVFTARLLAMLVLIGAILGTVFAFLFSLRRILDTVGAGDPFTPANGARLDLMGWLMVVLTLAIPCLPPVAGWVNELLSEPGTPDPFEFHFDGLLLALVLFILARVFRQGAAMRDDLEGTV